MISRTIAAALALGLATVAFAETPNVEPGLWQYENTMTFSGDVPIPDQNQTSEECVTAEDIAEGDAFLEDVDECEVTHKDVRRDGMDYSMICTQPDGTRMTMNAEMQFAGDSASGTINGDMETPMGAMQMTITVNGKRIGDCPAE